MSLFESKNSKKNAELFLAMVQTPLWDLVDELKDGQVITLYKGEGANVALRTLCENNILSAPVVDELGRYVGMMDTMALMTFSLDIFNETFRPDRFSDDYLAKKRRFRNTTVEQILTRQRGHEAKAMVIHEDYSLFHALEIMSLSKQHRLAVVDSNNYVTGLINQSLICKWLLDNQDKFHKDLKNTKCFDIRPFNLVSTINVNKRAIEAFTMLKNENLGGCAVLDSNGRICDVISTRDLRGINPDSQTFRFLWNTIDFFKDQVRESHPETPSRPVTVSPNSTFMQALRSMVDQKIHRLFVVSDTGERRPLDVISMSDMISFVVDTCKGEMD